MGAGDIAAAEVVVAEVEAGAAAGVDAVDMAVNLNVDVAAAVVVEVVDVDEVGFAVGEAEY